MMILLKKNILLYLCLTSIFNTISLAQDNSFWSPEKCHHSPAQDVVMSKILFIDTIFSISNPRISYKYMEHHFFENQAYFGFKTDSLYFPKYVSKKKFAENLLGPRSFYLLASSIFVNKVIIPEVTDTTLLQLLNQSYNNDDWECVILSKNEHKNNKYHYTAYTYNTHHFLSVFVRTDIFNLEYNKIFQPPKFLFPEESGKRAVFVKILIPLKMN